MEAEDQVSSVQEGLDISTEEEKLLYEMGCIDIEDEVTDKTPGAISKPVSFPVRKPHEIGEEIGEEDDVELAELRIKMEQTNKMWEETFERSEKERLKQEISQKEKQIKAYRKKASKKIDHAVPATTSVPANELHAVGPAITPATSSAGLYSQTGNGASTLPVPTTSTAGTPVVQSSQQDEPDFRPTFKVKGLERADIKQILSSKLRSINIQIGGNIIDDLIKTSTIRENKTNPYTLDQRNKPALNRLKKAGILPSTVKSATKLMERETKGQGNTKFDTVLKKKYHEKQNELLRLLIDDNMLKLTENTYLNKLGFIKLDNDKSIPTGMFCNLLDQCTQLCFENSYQNSEAHSLCTDIFALRSLMDMCIENDLIKIDKYEIWKKHLHVFASFGVLCCAINF